MRQSVPSWSMARTPKSWLEVMGSLMPTKWSGPPLSFMSVMSHPKNNFFSSTVPHCTALDSLCARRRVPFTEPLVPARPADQTVLERLPAQRPPVLAHHMWLGASRTWQSPQLSQIKTFLGPHGICPCLLNFLHNFVLQPNSLQSRGE